MMMLREPSLIIMMLFIEHIKFSNSAGNWEVNDFFLLFLLCGHFLFFTYASS